MFSSKWIVIVLCIIVLLIVIYLLIQKRMRNTKKKTKLKVRGMGANGTCYSSLQQCQTACTLVPCSSSYPNGACPAGKTCQNGTCICSTPCAQGQECGTDGCGESCGTCPAGKVCQNRKCTCTPNCTGKTCGDDGCGGSCGACNSGDTCVDGACVASGWTCSATSACSQNCEFTRPLGCPYAGSSPQFLTSLESGTYTLQYPNAGYLTVGTSAYSNPTAWLDPTASPTVWTYDSDTGSLSATVGGVVYQLAARNTQLDINCASGRIGLTDLVGAIGTANDGANGMPVSFVLGPNFLYSTDAQLFLKAMNTITNSSVTYSLSQSDASGWVITPVT